MRKVLISLVGDQTVPNVFLIRDAAFAQIDHYVFVTTPLMEQQQKLKHILAASLLPEDCWSKVEVVADNPHDIRAQLDTLPILQEANHIYVNLTSGTKVMSIGLYDYFTEATFAPRSHIFYISIAGNTFLQIFPESAFQQYPITYRITVAEYLTSYGIKIIDQRGPESLQAPAIYTETLLPRFLQMMQQGRAFAKMMEQLRKVYTGNQQKKDFEIPIWPELRTFLQEIDYEVLVEGRLQKRAAQYLIGGWLEEWAFVQVSTALQLPPEAIRFQVKVGRNNAIGAQVPNECDVLFTFNNTLYLLECKTGLGRNAKQLFEESVYKLAALRMEFGQRVNAIFLTLSDLRDNKGQLKKPFVNRASLHGIVLFDRKGVLEEFPAFLQELSAPKAS